MTPRKRKLNDIKAVYRPRGECRDCDWAVACGRFSRTAGKDHARVTGHTVYVVTEEVTTYYPDDVVG